MTVLRIALPVAMLLSISEQQTPNVRTVTSGVLIDVTVADKKGRPVVGLTPDDFEVKEDGVRQQLLSVVLVDRDRYQSGPEGSVPAVGSPESRPSAAGQDYDSARRALAVTAVLFDRVSQEGSQLARKAAAAYVASLSPDYDYAGVFVGDLAFRTLQPFTNQREKLLRAIDAFGSMATATLAHNASSSQNARIQAFDPLQPPTAGAESSGGFVSAMERERQLAQMNPIDRKLIEIQLRMEESYRQVLSQYEGQASIAALTAVVDALSRMPGRKSILYFAESLPISGAVRTRFDRLIGLANRGNITIYPVDAAGLRLHSKESELARVVGVASAQGVGDTKRSDGAWTKDLEQQEQALTSRPAAALGRLAKETGGFVIQDTNDLGAGVARMQLERSTDYLLGYQPSNGAPDGTFRRISVKVKRQDVSVRARPGYLATVEPALAR